MKRRGFTLIEVMVALAIVTVGMAAVLAAMTSAADTAFYLRNKTFAQWIALNRIAETRLKPTLPSKGKTNGEAEFAGSKWAWEQEVLPLQFGMLRIDVRVRPAAEGKKDSSWYATESGIVGDAVNYAGSGTPSDWDVQNARTGVLQP